jgi:two-component system chemotaxis sensor kinase CheA
VLGGTLVKTHQSISTRLALGTTVLVIALTAGAYFSLTRFQWRTMVAGRSASAFAVTQLFREVASTAVVFDDSKGLEENAQSLLSNPDVLFMRINKLDDKGAVGPTVIEKNRLKSAIPTLAWTGDGAVTAEDDLVLVSEPLKDSDGKSLAVAFVAFSLEKEREAYATLSRTILLTSLFVAFAVISLLMAMARRLVVRPLGLLADTAARLQAGEHVATGVNTQDEVGVLARALDAMAQAIWAREAEVQLRNRDMKLVLDSVNQGFLLLDARGVMGPARSGVLASWFGDASNSTTFSGWVAARASGFAAAFNVAFDQLAEGMMPLDVSLDMLPSGFDIGDNHYSVKYKAITAAGTDTVENLLVVVSDVTAELKHELIAATQRETVDIFQWLAKDKNGFTSFLIDAGAIVVRLQKPQGHQLELREVHTLKGNCAIFGVTTVASLCHQIESRLVEEQGELNQEERTAIESTWHVLSSTVKRLGGEGRHTIEVPREEYDSLLSTIAAGSSAETVASVVRSWSDDPVNGRLIHLGEQAKSLATRLSRLNPHVAVEAHGIRLSPTRFAPFWSAAVHVVRNAVDHGTETAEERAAAGKAATPQLSLSCELSGNQVIIKVADDGRGIDWQKLANKARQAGLPADSREALTDAIFADGVTTRDVATEISGRGVGMAAVRQVVHELGGSIRVESEPRKGTAFIFSIPRTQPELAIAA